MNDKLFHLYGYTWDEAPKHLKNAALHLSGALKINKFEAYELLINNPRTKFNDLESKYVKKNYWKQKKKWKDFDKEREEQ